LIFSKDLFKKEWDFITVYLKSKKISKEVYMRSVDFGNPVAMEILNGLKGDHHSQTRSRPRYTPLMKPGYCQQTAADFMEAIGFAV